MAIERRDFIRSGLVGLSAGFLTPQIAGAQKRAVRSTGALLGGTSSVHVEGRLKSGVLTVDAQEFTEGEDICLVMNGRIGTTDLYCSMFSYKSEEAVFAVMRSNGHRTSLLLSNSDDSKIANLVVGNDAETPNTFRIDKGKFTDTLSLKEAVVSGNSDSLDVVGKRNPPPFTLKELEAEFGDNEALNDFMRGHRSHHNTATVDAVFCDIVSNIPGSLTGLDWHAPPLSGGGSYKKGW